MICARKTIVQSCDLLLVFPPVRILQQTVCATMCFAFNSAMLNKKMLLRSMFSCHRFIAHDSKHRLYIVAFCLS